MSYILDALRKAERERTRSDVSDLLAVQSPFPIEAKGRTVRLSIVVTISVVIVLASLVGFGMWQGKRTPAHRADVQGLAGEAAPTVPGNGAETPPAVREARPPSVEGKTSPEKTPPVVPHPDARPKTPERPAPSESLPPKPRASASPVIAPLTPEILRDIPPPDENRLYSLQELPDAIRQRLPDFSFSVFLYTDEPTERTTRVNGVMVKEVQFVTDGLKLEEIRPEGVIFSYLNYHFYIRMP